MHDRDGSNKTSGLARGSVLADGPLQFSDDGLRGARPDGDLETNTSIDDRRRHRSRVPEECCDRRGITTIRIMVRESHDNRIDWTVRSQEFEPSSPKAGRRTPE
jgi:hypothetical protein